MELSIDAKQKALSMTIWQSSHESSEFNSKILVDIIKRHQQELADQVGRSISWREAVTGFFRETESSFLVLLSDARNQCYQSKNPDVLPS